MASLGEIDRRTFVKLSGASAAALVFGFGPYTERAVAQLGEFSEDPFGIGVASGDPSPDGIVLWTRLTPYRLDGDEDPELPNTTVPLRWELATDENFSNVVRSGTVDARPELAHSVHIEVGGLDAGREYFYRFKAQQETSPVGRTRTAPARGSSLDQLTFAVASCQMYEHGYYHAYRDMVEQAQSGGRDLDLVVHLGDYIYEYPPPPDPEAYYSEDGNVRRHVPNSETNLLAEYRRRHGQYKSDEDLQDAHRLFPWIVTWDDHEVENNYADEVSERDSSPEKFLERRAAAYQAYYEHMPLRRRSIPRGPDMLLYRRFTYGDLARFYVMDTRQYRDDQANGDGLDPPDKQTRNPRRTITGDAQERWLKDGLVASGATWDVLAQQVFFSKLDLRPGPGKLYNMDQWDGYEGQRDRLVEFFAQRNVRNPVVLTGDIHTNWANDIKRNFDEPDSRTVGTEYVGTSITSQGNGSGATSTEFPDNPHIKFFNEDRGYLRCTLTPQEWTTEYRVVKVVNQPVFQPAVTLATFVTEAGNPGAQLDGEVAATTQAAAPDIESIERNRIESQQGTQ